MRLTELEVDVMERSRSLKTGGVDLFYQFWTAPMGATQEQARMDLVGLSVDQYDPPLKKGEFVPMVTIPWAHDVVHVDYSQYCIIGGVGSGKTLNVVMAAGYFCAMLPNFRYLGTAPKSWQAEQSWRDYLVYVLDWENRSDHPRRITKWIKNIKSRPYPIIEFVNGSTMEFKSLDRDAQSILTWSGDMAAVDQAEDPSVDLESVMSNLGSRLRGSVGSRARLGKFVIMANSAYKPILWEVYDSFESDPNQYAKILTTYDNPYLTKRQIRDIERLFRDKEEAERLLRSKRPLPKGKEFTENLIKIAQSKELDKIMEDALESGDTGYAMEDSQSAGIVRWMTPPEDEKMYVMTGDPGQANPPYRNSAVIMIFDVTEFPSEPAKLALFHWVYGRGSYWPFINAMNHYYELYNPVEAGFDSTGTQKAFNDLGILDDDKMWTPLNMQGKKMHMVLCLKVLMGNGMIKMPKSLYSIWNQLLMWHMPDKSLRQDIASTLFMMGYMLNQLLPQKYQESEEDERFEKEMLNADRWAYNRVISERQSVRSLYD